MSGSTRGSRTIRRALAAGCLAALLLAAGMVADASAVRYQRESATAFEGQLNAGQIQSAVFNKKAHTLHLLLKDGRHALISYPAHEEPQLAAKLQAKGVSVQVTKKKPAKAVHHKLRYIAGGIVIVVIVVVAAVLFVDRRRKLNEAGGGGAHPASSSGDTA
jgi:ATP-dependent Zn protease